MSEERSIRSPHAEKVRDDAGEKRSDCIAKIAPEAVNADGPRAPQMLGDSRQTIFEIPFLNS